MSEQLISCNWGEGWHAIGGVRVAPASLGQIVNPQARRVAPGTLLVDAIFSTIRPTVAPFHYVSPS